MALDDFGTFLTCFRIQAHRPDLVRAQAEAVRRQMPILHFILAVNSWIIAIGYYGRAPALLAVVIPVALGAICAVRGVMFLVGTAPAAVPYETLVKTLRRSSLPTTILGVGFVSWGFALFPYGDDLMHLHLSFYMMATTLTSALCLMYLPVLAVLLIGIVILPCLLFDVWTGNPTLILVAANTLVIYVANLYVLTGYFRTFQDLVGARSDLEAQNREIGRLQAQAGETELRRKLERAQDLERIADAFTRSIEGVTRVLGEVSLENARQSREVALCSGLASERLDQVQLAAALSERSLSSVAEATTSIHRSIESSKRRTVDAASITKTVEPRTASADRAMTDLAATIGQIDAISVMIRTIAGQIDLIALNATIEAARAGDAGRGFAVVANEIKILASRTAHATDDIGRHIGDVKTASQAANASVAAMKSGFLALRAVSDEVASALDEQTDLAGDILHHVGRAVDGAASTRSYLLEMSATTDRTSSSAREMLDQSEVLSGEAGVLAREVTNFIGFIRAA